MSIFEKTLKEQNLILKDEIVSRRGVAVYEVKCDTGKKGALKVYMPDQDSRYNQQKLIIREAEILKSLKQPPAAKYVPEYYDHADTADITWLLSEWVAWPTSSEVTTEYRKNCSENKAKFLQIFKEILNALKTVHDAGFVHGDIQPAHIMVGKDTVKLIDWGLSRHVDDLDFQYKGSLVHFASPEVAAQMRERKEHIIHDQLSELYMICAVFFTLYTGKTATDYGTDDYKSITLNQKLDAVIGNNKNSFDNAGVEPWYELEAVLNLGLKYDRQERIANLTALSAKIDEM